jgi:hypothetical protein
MVVMAEMGGKRHSLAWPVLCGLLGSVVCQGVKNMAIVAAGPQAGMVLLLCCSLSLICDSSLHKSKAQSLCCEWWFLERPCCQ